MDDTLKSILTGLIRYVLIGIFGNLIAKGYVTENNLLLASGLIAGALLVVGSMIWRKIKTRFRIEAASQLPANAGMDEIKELADKKLAKVSSLTKVLP